MYRRFTQKCLIIESAFWLTLAKFSLLFLHFRQIAPHLGEAKFETPFFVNENKEKMSLQIKRSISSASVRLPWAPKCFEQAIAAKMLLKRKNISSTVYFGIQRDSNNKIQAHAWLRCGNLIVTGEGNIEKFTTVSHFGERTS